MMQMMARFGGKDSNDECFAHGLAFHFFFLLNEKQKTIQSSKSKNRKLLKFRPQKQKTIEVQTSK